MHLKFVHKIFGFPSDIPSFSDPRIPIVAAEILQTMISQFAGEYTSKTSCPQNSHPDPMPHTDQSLPGQALLSGAPPPTSPAALATETAPNQNPVLSKLLMADQDAPLDLTIKKNPAESSEQGRVNVFIMLILQRLLQLVNWLEVIILELSFFNRWSARPVYKKETL